MHTRGVFFVFCARAPHAYMQQLGAYSCHGQGGHQAFFLSLRGELRTSQGQCADAYVNPNDPNANKDAASNKQRKIWLDPCHGMQGNQQWIAVPPPGDAKNLDGTVMLKHSSGMCMELVPEGGDSHNRVLGLTKACDGGNPNMLWKFKQFDYSKIEKVHHRL
jgi:hypothetical protein